MTPTPPQFSRSDGNGVVRVTVAGELDMATVPELDQVLSDAEARAPLVVLDLRALEFIDCSGAHLMLAADRRIRQAGGRFVVVRGGACVERLFALIGIHRQLELMDQPPSQPGAQTVSGAQHFCGSGAITATRSNTSRSSPSDRRSPSGGPPLSPPLCGGPPALAGPAASRTDEGGSRPAATMSTIHKLANLAAVGLPFLAFLVAIALLWNSYVGWSDLAILALMYVLTGFGVTVGFHRLLTHRAFETYRPIKYALAALGSMAVEGPAIVWVADHRKHHTFADEEGDPHSPHVDFGEGWRGALRGLWHAHTGWLFDGQGRAESKRFARDLLADGGLRLITKRFPVFVALGLAIPFLLGLAFTQSLAGGLTALLWGGFVRIFLLHHVTWSINSVCHFFGRRRFATDDQSTNVFWLALPSFGESWHHNHHAFPTSARHGLRWWEIDPSALLIGALERLGLAWNVVKVPPERQRAKLASSVAA